MKETKRNYVAPVLIKLGEVRELVKSGGSDTPDSSNPPGTRRP